MSCPPFEELLRVRAFEGVIPASAAVREHLDRGCAACRQRLAIGDRLAGSVGSQPLAKVSTELMDAVMRIPNALKDAVQRVATDAADLVCDPRTAPAGFRGEGYAEPHWLYRSGNWDVDVVAIEPGVLAGQVLARDGRSIADGACVLHSDWDVRQTEFDSETGEFLFEDLRPERYSLLVEAANLSISIPDIDLAADSGAL